MHPTFKDKLSHRSIYKWVTSLSFTPSLKLLTRLVITHRLKLFGVVLGVGVRIIKENICIKLTPSNLFAEGIVGFALT